MQKVFRVLKKDLNTISTLKDVCRACEVEYTTTEDGNWLIFMLEGEIDVADISLISNIFHKCVHEYLMKEEENIKKMQEKAFKESDEESITIDDSDDDLGIDFDSLDDDEIDDFFIKKPLDKKVDNLALITKIKALKEELSSIVKGQEVAINKLSQIFYNIEAFKNDDRKIKGSILFAGPSGVGKTFLAKTFAKVLDMDFKEVNMGEYCDKDAIFRFRGFDSSYKNSTPGVVTSYVNEHPNCILLLDEIDKADYQMQNLLLELYNEGKIRDTKLEKDVSFKNVIVIYTTNVGKALYEDENIDIARINDSKIIDAIVKEKSPNTNNPIFSKSIVSRFSSGGIVMFNNLNPYDLTNIAKNKFEQIINNYMNNNKYNIKVKNMDELVSALVFHGGGKADARRLNADVEKYIQEEIFEGLNQLKQKNQITDSINIVFNIDKKEISKLELKGKTKGILFMNSDDANTIKNVKKTITFTDTTNLVEAESLLKKDIDFIIIDLYLNSKDTSNLLDINDISSDGRKLIDYVFEFNREVPVYVLNRTMDIKDYESLIDRGVKGIVTLDKSLKTLKNDINALEHISLLGKKCYKLRRNNQVLSYRVRKTFIKDTMYLEMTDLEYKTCFMVEDNDFLLEKPDIKFKDVIGCEDAKRTLNDFLKYLNKPFDYISSGSKPPKGVLFYGSPGTGKTLLAKALAGEANNCSFIQKTASDFVGRDPMIIEQLFKKAKKYAPAIIFVDEIDAIAKERTGCSPTEPILNKLLTELDGFSEVNPKKPVLFIAATNFQIERTANGQIPLDGAFVRRFDRTINIDLPDENERKQIIKMYLEKHMVYSISEDCINNLASRTIKYSPDNIEKLISHAIRMAESPDKLTDEILTDSFDANRFGEKSNELPVDEQKRTAVHEAGHALVSYLTNNKVNHITIKSRGSFGGYTSFKTNENLSYSREDLLNRITIAFAGRAAEEIYYGEKGINTGSSEDLKIATNIAKAMIEKYGMSDNLVCLDSFESLKAQKVYDEVVKMLKIEYERAKKFITHYKAKLDELVDALLKKQTLNEKEINTIFEDLIADGMYLQ